MMGSTTQRLSRRWGIQQTLAGFWLALVTTLVFIAPLTHGYQLEVGSVVSQDIRSPRRVTFVSEIRSRQAQEEAVRRVAPVYTAPDLTIAREQLTRSRQGLAFLGAVRLDPYATEAQRQAWVRAVPELSTLPSNVVALLLELPESNWSAIQLEVVQLLDQVMRQEEIRPERLASVAERIPALVSLDLAQDEATVVTALVQRFLKPNSFYDEAATEAAREQARAATTPVFTTVQNGEVIIREGSVVTELTLETLEALGLTQRQRDWGNLGPELLLAIGGTLLLGCYLFRAQPDVLATPRLEALLVLLLTGFIVLARLLIPAGLLLPYLFPGAALAMLLATTLGTPAALGGLLFLGLVCGWLGGHSLELLILVTMGGLAALLALPRYEQTGPIFRSGLLGGLVQALTALAFATTELRADPLAGLLKVGVALAGGLVASGLTVGGLFLLGPLFDLATTFRLLELSRPNHPLLQRLLRETPGTYHHTIMVASMAEQAAERIGANALLTRVGAYYHDIGKLARPYFFVENQEGLSNPHDRLDPRASVEVLNSHIRDGAALAREYRLPARVRAFILEHHGTMRASFFYQKAVQAAGAEASLVDEADFRYPGPRPQSRETLLVMLADACEAATRANRPANPDEVARIVQAIFESRIRDGQLNDCPITMHELELVRQTYIEVLRGAFHPRVQYPDFKVSRERDEPSLSS